MLKSTDPAQFMITFKFYNNSWSRSGFKPRSFLLRSIGMSFTLFLINTLNPFMPRLILSMSKIWESLISLLYRLYSSPGVPYPWIQINMKFELNLPRLLSLNRSILLREKSLVFSQGQPCLLYKIMVWMVNWIGILT